MTEPLVSVLLVTYNHEAFIEQALDSVLAQRSDVDLELLICEDCSTDRTREIVRGLAARHPGFVRLYLTERNRNDNEVFACAWREARGSYLAYLDGDDYWTDPQKLAKQISLLERHPGLFVSGHAVRQIDASGAVVKESKFDIFEDHWLSPEELASGLGCPIPALSAVWRNQGGVPPAESFNRVFNADTFMFAYFANFGGGFVTREVMGVHRIHAGSVWSLLDDAASADLRNATLRRIPSVLRPDLRALGWYGLLRHSRYEDRRRWRRVRDTTLGLVRMMFSLRPRSARFLARRLGGKSKNSAS